MRLAQFITSSSERIAGEWEVFARTCTPAAGTMSLEQRRDHIEEMLKAVALDLETTQTAPQQAQKSKGLEDVDGPRTAAHAHGTDRAATGYTPEQMVSEFRALRASVLRLWSESRGDLDRTSLEDVSRFNEAIDQLLAESIQTYAADVERSKDLLLGVLGHDLRNPLGAIMMSASVMLAEEGPAWPQAATASRILRSVTRMDGMIRDLVDFTSSRLGAGLSVSCAEMDMEATCRHTAEEISAFHPRCTVEFTAEGPLRGEWDAGRIAQALSNLISNAYQHGAPETAVRVAVRGERHDVVLSVHNDGPPIPPNELRNIFDPFKQLKPGRGKSKDPRSVGLGLYIAQAIALAHRGAIEAESRDGGTMFTMRLPRQR